MVRRARAGGLAACVALSSACASLEAGRYGVTSLEIAGTHAVAGAAITDCLISRERDSFSITVGMGMPQCGVPPFDTAPPRLRLWRWPWTEWPSFNRAVFDRDLEGILRFYRARGYHAAKIAEVHIEPEAAARTGGAGHCESEDCRIAIRVVIDEGAPTLVERLALLGLDEVPEEVRREAHAAIQLGVGRPPDEALHDRSKQAIHDVLYAAGWAGVRVSGRVVVDRERRRADVEYHVERGPLYHFGRLEVSGQGDLPRAVIEQAADLRAGDRFDPAVLREIQAEVFALGAFSVVDVHEQLDPASARADVVVGVSPLPLDALRVGAGVLSGALRRTDTSGEQSIPQWDVHLFGRYTRRHLFGSLAQLTLEDRPRLIFSAAFPSFESPRPGNVVSVALTQPGWFEPRTTAFAKTVWDYGPDPYLDFFRSDLFIRTGLTRGFFRRHLIGTLAAQQDVFNVLDSDATSDVEEATGAEVDDAAGGDAAAADSNSETDVPTSYGYTFLEQDLRLDLRDSRTRPRRGAYFGFNATEAPRWAGSDWTAVRLAPEARTYVPLPLGMVLAQRFALASLFVLDASPELDETSRELGPNNYRLRGGGASSNRGFLAGELGVGVEGGTRRWEGSLELRVPIGQSLEVAGFADIGDVSVGAYRFSHLNTTLGYGLRYHTVIGAIRFDVGYRIPAWQRTDGSDGVGDGANELPLSHAPGAIHLTIGDPF